MAKMHPSDRVRCWLAALWVAKGVWRLQEEAQRAMCWKPCLGGTSLGRPFWVQMPSSNFLTWELNGLLPLQLLSSGCFPFQVEVTILLSLCWLPSPGKNQIGLEPKNFCIIQTPFPYFPSKPKQMRIELGVVAEETAQYLVRTCRCQASKHPRHATSSCRHHTQNSDTSNQYVFTRCLLGDWHSGSCRGKNKGHANQPLFELVWLFPCYGLWDHQFNDTRLVLHL